MPLDQDALADVVVLTVKAALAPLQSDVKTLQTQIAGWEARWNDLGALRERVAVVEAKPLPVPVTPPTVDLSPLTVAVADLTKDFGSIRERMAVLETRPQVQGPKGDPGDPGKDGQDGAPGLAGLSYEGVYQDGKSYDIGNLVTWGGSMWHANESTTTKPGEGSKAWTLTVKRGRDGKDGRDALDLVPAVRVR